MATPEMIEREAPATLATARRHLRAQRALLVAALALVLPSLGAGFFADDYVQIAQIEGWSANPASPFDLYSFIPRDRATVERLRAEGFLPYFSAPNLQIRFLRPLSSALMWLDHTVFGRAPAGYHAHTLLWFVVLLAAAAAILRRALPPPLATLAVVIFCFDGSHAMAAAWVAARNATVACALAFLAFLAYRRWREEGWRPGAVLAPLAAALGLAAGEMALGALAYLVAWEVVEPRPRRARALAPLLAVAAIYLGIYAGGHYGARGSGAYLDPFGDPAGFLRALPGRALLALGSALVAAPIDLVTADDRLRLPLTLVGAASGLVVAGWLPRALRRMSPGEARAVRAFGLGAAGALLVGTPALPGERVVMAASLGAAVVLAALLRDAWRLVRARRARVVAALGLALFGAPNVALAPLALGGKVLFLRGWAEDARRVVREAEIDAPVPAHVVVLALDDLLPMHLPVQRVLELGLGPEEMLRLEAARARDAATLPLPDRLGYLGTTALSLAAAPHRLRRTAADAFELSTPSGSFFDGTWAGCLRAPSLPLPAGTVIRGAALTATVREDRGGRPTRVEVRFDRPLDDPSLVFLALVDGRLRRFPMPAIGGEVVVPHERPLIPRASR